MSTTATYSTRFAGSETTPAPKPRSLFLRLIDRMVEARMRRAEEFIRQNQHLIPRDLEA